MSRRRSRKQSIQIPEEERYIKEPIKTVHGQIHIKKYIKLKKIGSGSYSKCYLVRNLQSESTYAVKIIPKNKLQILLREKLFYEIKIHQSLSHKNIVYFDHWFEDDNHQYIFMEYCAQGNLQNELKNQGGMMGEKAIQKYGWEITQAIKYIHQQKIMHRDLKLCNFYLDDSKQIKLGDFGFACQLANQNDKKRESCGTPNYIAPETISGYGYSFSSDVWSIGAILYRMKYGFCPFEGPTVRITLEKVKMCDYIFPKNIKISRQLKDLIQKILVINYDDRLTTEQILAHEFFSCFHSSNKIQKTDKRSSSLLTRIFSSGKSAKKQQKKAVDPKITNKEPILTNTENKRIINKSNSCETLKQIKQIFKSKSKNKNHSTNMHNLTTLPNSLNTIGSINATSPSYRYTEQNQEVINSPLWSRIGQQSLRMSISQRSINQNGKRQQSSNRISRINQFVKNKAETMTNKQIPTMSKNRSNLINKPTKKYRIILDKILSHYYLPQKVQFEKDIIIIHYSDSIKQLVYPDQNSQLFNNDGNMEKWHKIIKEKQGSSKKIKIDEISKSTMDGSSAPVFTQMNMNMGVKNSKLDNNFYLLTHKGHQVRIMVNNCEVPIENIPKIVRYVIENKIEWQYKSTHQNFEDHQEISFEERQQNFGFSKTQQIYRKIATSLTASKDGIIIKYGNQQSPSKLIIGKISSQNCFYISANNAPILNDSKNDKELIVMYEYNASRAEYIVLEEVGMTRMYAGWLKMMLRK